MPGLLGRCCHCYLSWWRTSSNLCRWNLPSLPAFLCSPSGQVATALTVSPTCCEFGRTRLLPLRPLPGQLPAPCWGPASSPAPEFQAEVLSPAVGGCPVPKVWYFPCFLSDRHHPLLGCLLVGSERGCRRGPESYSSLLTPHYHVPYI